MKAFKSGSGEIVYDKISDRQLGKIYSEIRDGFLKEMRVAENTGDLERIVNRQKAGVDSKFINSTIVAAALQVMNEDQKKFRIDDGSTESGQSGSTDIDSGAESGYNGERGESYADNDQRRLGENAEEDSGIDRRGEEEAGRAWRENKENDLRGAQERQAGGRPQEWIHVKQGSLDIYYKPGRTDGGESYVNNDKQKSWENMPKMTRKLTEEEKKKLEELGEKMRKMTYEERRKGRLEEYEKNGYI